MRRAREAVLADDYEAFYEAWMASLAAQDDQPDGHAAASPPRSAVWRWSRFRVFRCAGPSGQTAMPRDRVWRKASAGADRLTIAGMLLLARRACKRYNGMNNRSKAVDASRGAARPERAAPSWHATIENPRNGEGRLRSRSRGGRRRLRTWALRPRWWTRCPWAWLSARCVTVRLFRFSSARPPVRCTAARARNTTRASPKESPCSRSTTWRLPSSGSAVPHRFRGTTTCK